MQAIVAHHLHSFPDLVGRDHGGVPGARFEQTPVLRLSSRRMRAKLASPWLEAAGQRDRCFDALPK
jgi:hypothetical protein